MTDPDDRGLKVLEGTVDAVDERPSGDVIDAQIRFDTSDVPADVPLVEWLEGATATFSVAVEEAEE